jgi:hypothetical protein
MKQFSPPAIFIDKDFVEVKYYLWYIPFILAVDNSGNIIEPIPDITHTSPTTFTVKFDKPKTGEILYEDDSVSNY